MAIFQLRVANCTVVQSKSENADTLVGSCSLIVYNSEGSVHNALWAPLSASLVATFQVQMCQSI